MSRTLDRKCDSISSSLTRLALSVAVLSATTAFLTRSPWPLASSQVRVSEASRASSMLPPETITTVSARCSVGRMTECTIPVPQSVSMIE